MRGLSWECAWFELLEPRSALSFNFYIHIFKSWRLRTWIKKLVQWQSRAVMNMDMPSILPSAGGAFSLSGSVCILTLSFMQFQLESVLSRTERVLLRRWVKGTVTACPSHLASQWSKLTQIFSNVTMNIYKIQLLIYFNEISVCYSRAFYASSLQHLKQFCSPLGRKCIHIQKKSSSNV